METSKGVSLSKIVAQSSLIAALPLLRIRSNSSITRLRHPLLLLLFQLCC